jgi:hypothetical protein
MRRCAAFRWILLLPALALCLGVPLVTRADERAPATQPASSKTDFIRYVDDGHGGARLEAAIVTYRQPETGVVVHLVAALHVAEPSYYDYLNKTFRGYDAVLYEMVKPKGMAVPPPGVRTGSAVSAFQRFLKDQLKLQFQLDAVDYTPANFVHADMDAETFFRLQEERGESMLTLMFRSMLNEMKRQAAGQGGPPITVFDLLAAMTSPDSARAYKLLLGKQFQNIEAQIAGIDGPNGSVILSERNKAALKVLKETIKEPGKTNVGVFFGAGHMPGIEKVLTGEMGFERVGAEWVLAWDMKAPKAPEGEKGRAGEGEKKH